MWIGSQRTCRWLAEVATIAVVYYAAARLGLQLAFRESNATPVWPPSGIALAALFLRGWRVWPGVMLGAFAANVVVFLGNGVAHFGSIAAVSGAIAVGNTAEALLAIIFIPRWIGSANPLDRASDVFRFAIVTTLACSIASTMGATSLFAAGIIPSAIYQTVWLTWWIGDVSGILIITPLILAWCRPAVWRYRASVFQGAALLALLIGGAYVVFGGHSIPGNRMAYLLIPLVLWAAFQFGQRGVALATVIVTGAAVWATVNAQGPFNRSSLNESLLLLQIFIGTVTATGLILSAVLTERAQAEAALHEAHQGLSRHAAQLQAANKELEAFAYSVSHDLRAPLRSIDGFSQALVEDYGDQLGTDGQETLQRVRAASQRMGQLIDDLLKLSLVTRMEMEPESVDLSALARELGSELRQRSPDSAVEFNVADGLTARGDRRLLRVALDNLLNNAWKFTSRTAQPRIEFGTAQSEAEPVFFVRDNGAGFDMGYAAKLFGAFQRLHGVQEFPGTGIGLATVQRVIHRHGGRVWADGAVGRGATFFFTLETGANPRPTE